MSLPKFPNTLYVTEQISPRSDPWLGYPGWNGAPDGSYVAVYALQSISRVKEEMTKSLIDPDGKVRQSISSLDVEAI